MPLLLYLYMNDSRFGSEKKKKKKNSSCKISNEVFLINLLLEKDLTRIRDIRLKRKPKEDILYYSPSISSIFYLMDKRGSQDGLNNLKRIPCSLIVQSSVGSHFAFGK